MSSAERPADVMHQAEAEFRRRAQDPHLTRIERDQYAATADLFGVLASEMASLSAFEIREPHGMVVVDGPRELERSRWTTGLAAARAWLVPTPEVDR